MHESGSDPRARDRARERRSAISFSLTQTVIVLLLGLAFVELDDVYINAFVDGLREIIASAVATYAAQ